MKIEHKISPDLSGIPQDQRKDALEAAAEFIKEQMLSYIAEGESPVDGGKWRKELTEKYAEIKDKLSSSNFANMELSGELLDSLEFLANSRSISIVVPSDQAGKAEGNLIGSYGQDKPRPKYAREFMPYKKNQQLRDEILQGVDEILDRYRDG